MKRIIISSFALFLVVLLLNASSFERYVDLLQLNAETSTAQSSVAVDAPTISSLSNGFVNNTTARIYLNAPETGTLYWAVYPASSKKLNKDAVKYGAKALFKGSLDYKTPAVMDYFTLTGLKKNKKYKLYATLQVGDKLSEVQTTAFKTTRVALNLDTEIEAVQSLLSRLLPARANDFEFEALAKIDDSRDVFEISSKKKKILIKASTGTAFTYGLNYYLNNYCNASFSWNGDQNVLPSPLPVVPQTIRKETPYTYRYSLNYCTHNYTMAFWDWNRWERELDLMAMQGVNLFLSPIGSEAVWQKTLEHFGYSFSEIQDYIAGPAYTAWWLMDNLEGEGGKVSQAYIDQRTDLQRKIMARAKELGMSVVLQGYAGMVPSTFAAKVPEATVINQGGWCGYGRPPMVVGEYCDTIAQYWYEESIKLFGAADFYGGDAFHEGGIVPQDLDLAQYATNLQSWMLKANPKSTWVLQAWQSNPNRKFLEGVKKDQCLILDYSNEINAFWENRNGFDGYPWVYGVINNFGGRMGIYARLQKVADDVYGMQHSPIKNNNIGIGIAPEAIVYNQVSYDIIWDLAWDTAHVNSHDWVSKFADRRYGIALESAQKAWQILNTTALACHTDQQGGTESVINARPSLNIGAVSCCSTSKLYYNPKDIIPAWTHMMNSIDVLKDKSTFRYDLVDLSRQVLTDFSRQVYEEMVQAFNDSNKTVFAEKSALFLDIMIDQDSLLSTREEFLLGKWIADARDLGNSAEESDIFELNARALPTTWNTQHDGFLHEYAHHEWAGLTKDYYRDRWKLFIDELSARLDGKEAQRINFFADYEKAWINKKGNGFAVVPTGKEIEMSTYIYNKYMPILGYE